VLSSGFSSRRPVDEGRFNRYSLETDGKRRNDTVHVWEDGCLHSLGCPGLG